MMLKNEPSQLGANSMTVAPWLVASKAASLENVLAVSTWFLNGSWIECHEKKHQTFSLPGVRFGSRAIQFFGWKSAWRWSGRKRTFHPSLTSSLTVFPVKPWTPKKIAGMFIVSRPIRWEMKPQKITDKQQQGTSHDLIRNNELAFSSTRNLEFSLWISLKKLLFDHKATQVTWFRLFKNQTTE